MKLNIFKKIVPFLRGRMLISFLLAGSLLAAASPAAAQNSQKLSKEEVNAYDPFADYSEFENTAEEQENIIFFQTGRFLSLGVMGGIQLFTMNMARLHKPGPFFGGYLTYFFDLQFAMQFNISASSHRVQFATSDGGAFVGASDFINLGVDFKYFLSKNLFHKNIEWLRPFLFLGPFYSSRTTSATVTNQAGFNEDKGFGINFGLGTEFHFAKKIHFGFQYIFHFVTMNTEAVPLQLTTAGGQVGTNFRPQGDWMTISMILGVNF